MRLLYIEHQQYVSDRVVEDSMYSYMWSVLNGLTHLESFLVIFYRYQYYPHVSYIKPWPTANNNISCLQTIKTFNDDVLHLELKITVQRPCLPKRWKPRSTSANIDSPQATHNPETVVNKLPTFKNWKHYKTKMSGSPWKFWSSDNTGLQLPRAAAGQCEIATSL